MRAQVVRRSDGCDVYIGRPGPWSNPFVIGRDGSRSEVVERFEQWFRRSDDPRARWMRAHVHELHGKRLGPLDCHGDVLAYWAEVKFFERVGEE